MKSLYQDYDALAYRPHNVGEERGAINHVKKAKARQKGLEITFNPKEHREFVTGFRKRKQQRRKVANSQLERKAKQQRVEARAERRKEMKQQLKLPEDYGVQDSDSEQETAAAAEAAAAKAAVKQYQQGGFTTTVSVTALNPGYSSDEDEGPAAHEAGLDDDLGGAADNGGGGGGQRQQLPVRQQPTHHGSKALKAVKQGRAGKKPSGKHKKGGGKKRT